jgi:glycosyltransferase involved in cell wall biosynthesis
MRLLFVHQNFGAFGGAETNIQITADELMQRGHAVALIHAAETGRSSESWERTFPARFPLLANGQPEAIASALDTFAPDIIYLHTLPDVEVIEALLDSSVPVIRMVHDHSLYCLRSYKYNPLTRAICHRPASLYCAFPCMAPVARNRKGAFPLKWNRLAAHRRELDLNRRCARFIVYSEYSKAELVNNGFDPDKIHIHVPMRCEDEAPSSSFGERNLILFAGQVIRGKGVDLLLKALAKLNVPFECLILGEGNHRRYCQRLCARLNLADRVQFRGFVPSNELQKFYADASVFVVPSVWPEPFGMAGPEAMRYGLPVVAFDSGGIKEWLIHGENGFLAPWMDTGCFAARIEELLRNKQLARQMGGHGRERVNRVYSASRQVDSLEQIFLSAALENKKHAGNIHLPNLEPSQDNITLPDFSAFPGSTCVESLTHSTTANV